ncbi:MAG: hypothetical protein QXH59_08210 [Candidatus Caldarchaeum sp.]
MVRKKESGKLVIVFLLLTAVVSGFLWITGILPFRTLPLEPDPIYWVTPEAIKLGRVESVPLPYLGVITYDFRNTEYKLVPKPTDITSYYFGQPIRWSPSRWDLSSIQTAREDFYTVKFYGFDIDLDEIDKGLPDVGVIVKLTAYQSGVADYTVMTYVCAQGENQQSQNSEYYWSFKDTYIVLWIDPYYLMTRLEIDGNAIPGPELPRTGGWKWIVPVASKAPSDPLASTFSLLERLWPWGVGSRCLTSISVAKVYVDTSVPVNTARTTVFNPTVTVTGVTTITVSNPTTIIYTSWKEVTRTLTYVSQKVVYETVERGVTRTVTTTVQGPSIILTTTYAGRESATTVTKVLQQGDTIVSTRYVTTTVQVPVGGGGGGEVIVSEVVKVVKEIPASLWLVIGVMLIILTIIAFSAGRRTSRTSVRRGYYAT